MLQVIREEKITFPYNQRKKIPNPSQRCLLPLLQSSQANQERKKTLSSQDICKLEKKMVTKSLKKSVPNNQKLIPESEPSPSASSFPHFFPYPFLHLPFLLPFSVSYGRTGMIGRLGTLGEKEKQDKWLVGVGRGRDQEKRGGVLRKKLERKRRGQESPFFNFAISVGSLSFIFFKAGCTYEFKFHRSTKISSNGINSLYLYIYIYIYTRRILFQAQCTSYPMHNIFFFEK